ncbi:MAG: endonuclease/exonuclease/phosphatase family protein [Candidatus Marinimicrobia bacterium]|nr:endonuclease/exonuclease/phosphatase family protein [Candidatus Neomarinimicrobiota bacterium]MCF7829068.1 endonuclease/exonuclease/phosphatase family protein [Candidatus Neomarinimicrobiota bacterium]MCF7881795.1 endonuclease/exonuclease/phosphatase family protein [Candidatus Neomarinimicrobiota bacterium]
MSKRYGLIAALVVLLSSAALISGERENTQTIHLLFTNDLLGGIATVPAGFMNPENPPMLSGGAGAYTYVQDIRKKAEKRGEHTLLLDGGNFYSGTVLGTYDRGATMIKWMNWMGYDVAAIGPFDFDYGVENMQRLTELAEFPYLSANILSESSGESVEFTRPYILKEFGDVTVGIFGLTNANLKEQVLPSRVKSITVQPPVSVAKELVQAVKSQGADIVIALTSLGLPYDRQEEYENFIERLDQGDTDWSDQPVNALQLAHLVPGIDIIATGGNTAGYYSPWEDPVTHTLVIQNYGNGSGLAHLMLKIDKETKSLAGYDTPLDDGMSITLLQDDILPDLTMRDSIDVWTTQAKKSLDRDYSRTIDSLFAVSSGNGSSAMPGYQQKLSYDWDIPSVNQVNGIEAMTWNIEQFPHAGDTTVQSVAAVLRDLQPDIVALQEIGNLAEFERLMTLVPEYGYTVSQHSSFYDQAIIYHKDVLTFLGQREFFTLNDYYFAGRPPFQADFLWRNGDAAVPLSVVNLHLKCCGDGLYRRQRSMEQLHENLRAQMANGNTNIIVMGDWNDELGDTGIYQSFYPFLEDATHFRFATMEIADDPEQASYPSWPSFLDHILYSKGLFDEQAAGGSTETVRLDDYLGSWDRYESLISDHRPVLWTIPVGE